MNYGRVSTATFIAAMAIVFPTLRHLEGESTVAYKDVVGVWTICNGETEGVKPGMKVSKEFCKQLLKARSEGFGEHVARSMKVDVPASVIAGHTIFAYNIGKVGYSTSRTLKLTNQGKLAEGCHAMMGWYKAGGKDCRIRSNGCYGLINHRKESIRICLQGL